MADQSLILREYLMPTAGSTRMEANENGRARAGSVLRRDSASGTGYYWKDRHPGAALHG
jgi:hypothetical protein